MFLKILNQDQNAGNATRVHAQACSPQTQKGQLFRFAYNTTVQGITFMDAAGNQVAVTFAAAAASMEAAVATIREALTSYGYWPDSSAQADIYYVRPTSGATGTLVIAGEMDVVSIQHTAGSDATPIELPNKRGVSTYELTYGGGTHDLEINGVTYTTATNTYGVTSVADVRTNILAALALTSYDYQNVEVGDTGAAFVIHIVAESDLAIELNNVAFAETAERASFVL